MSAGLLEHVGVPYADPEALVEAVGGRVAAALADGDDVYLSVDRRTARGFRDRLGRRGERVVYPSPTRWPQDVVRDLRGVARPGRRTLVLGQYTASGLDGREMAQIEDGVNLVLGDLPLTLLCTCAAAASPALASSLRFGHPLLWGDGAAVENPDYRRPAAYRPVTGGLWGPPTVRLDFRAPDDLHRLREHVTRAAETVGLRGETVREAVLATHEAALLAAGGVAAAADPWERGAQELVDGVDGMDGDAGARGTAGAEPSGVSCVLEVRADAGVLHCEILGPRPHGDSVGTDDPLRIVRLFCDRALLHDEADVRSVRVLSAPTGGRPAA